MQNPKTQAITKRLHEVADPLAEHLGMEVVEIVFVDARRRPTIRVFVDKDGGVTLDDCAEMSRRIGAALDETDVMPGPYNLEVSSPGAERPFSSLKQYQRNLNKPVEVVLQEPIDNRSHLKGTLVEVDPERIVVHTDEGHPVEVPLSRIKRANRVVTF
jgi:ribosome maturation factor RimP